ncbi:MAG: TIGR00730 family Rossman fold protein [Betaproteobacteria bacterium]|nr:TIGR00730 family Rossman fold protein [Betaproteobacteria bacterium]|tara:strand:+ start:2393 stop:2977 length:585 start_codon:yes stop_codon:yes gene_type:complete
MTIQRIAVYCGSKIGLSDAYQVMARELAMTLVDERVELVFGGGKVGLMGVLADTVLAHGGKVTGVIPSGLDIDEVVHKDLTELVKVPGMHQRKAMMLDLADAFIAMPGGIGTMDEIFEAWTWGQLGIHTKPVGLLNVEGYFDSLIEYLSTMVRQGFLSQKHHDRLYISESPSDLLEKMRLSNKQHETIWLDNGV